MDSLTDKTYKHFIGGEWQSSKGGKTFDTYNPANGEKLATLAEAGQEDVDAAVKAAEIAFKTWKHVSLTERAAILLKIAEVMEANLQKLAMIETLDNGKPLRESMYMDVPLAAQHFRYFSGVAMTEEGGVKNIDKDTIALLVKEPIGVAAEIVPWNFPLLLSSWKIAPALAAGCTIVLKPSSETSVSILEFAKLVQGILPAGVFNVVTGKGSTTGQFLIDHQGISKTSFTGSTEIGRTIAEASAKKLIPSTQELGGKSANIFFPDMPWAKAMDAIKLGILLNQGQVCAAGSRVFVHEDIYDKVLAESVAAFEQIKVGDPMNLETQMGAMINETQVEKVLRYIEIAKSEGARVACGGYRLTDGSLRNGCFFKPTILADVKNSMRIAREEIFGPVVCFIKFKTEEEVIEMANDNDYGLAGAVWTQDINRALRVAGAIEAGTMWVNNYLTLAAGAPFGGNKASGYGRECHKMTYDSYSYTKTIMISLHSNPSGMY